MYARRSDQIPMVKADKGEKAMTNEVLSVVIAHKPRDITEAMLCLQMASIHLATPTPSPRFAIRTIKIDAGDLANKLSRTFTMQVDALKRYRTKKGPGTARRGRAQAHQRCVWWSGRYRRRTLRGWGWHQKQKVNPMTGRALLRL